MDPRQALLSKKPKSKSKSKSKHQPLVDPQRKKEPKVEPKEKPKEELKEVFEEEPEVELEEEPGKEDKSIWESMQVRRRDPSEPMDETEARLIKVFKDNHITNAPEVSQDFEMIQSKSICKKCLLFKKVCQILGNHVAETSAESQPK